MVILTNPASRGVAKNRVEAHDSDLESSLERAGLELWLPGSPAGHPELY